MSSSLRDMLPRRRTERARRKQQKAPNGKKTRDQPSPAKLGWNREELRKHPVALIARIGNNEEWCSDARNERYWVFSQHHRGPRTIVLREVVRHVESKVRRDTEGLGGGLHFLPRYPFETWSPGVTDNGRAANRNTFSLE